MTPHQQWQKTTRAARRQRLTAFHSCATADSVAKFNRHEREMRDRVQKLVDAKVAPLLFGDYVNLANGR